MSKNIKLLYCILGSVILTFLNNPIFEHSKLGIFESGYGGYLFGRLLFRLTDVLSLFGFALLIVFSVLLIVTNVNFKDK